MEMAEIVESLKELEHVVYAEDSLLPTFSLRETCKKREEVQSVLKVFKKAVKLFEDHKENIEDHILSHIKSLGLKSVGVEGDDGKKRTYYLYRDVVFKIKDYKEFADYLTKTGHYSLLQNRLNRSSVQEELDNGTSIPGIESVTLTKLRSTG